MKILFILLLSFCAQAQTYLLADSINNFNNPDGSELILLYFDTTYVHQVLNDSINKDQSGNENDLAIFGWSNYADMVGSSAGSSPNYVGGKAIDPNGTSHYLNTGDYDPGNSDFIFGIWAPVQEGQQINMREMNNAFFGGTAGAAGWALEVRNGNNNLNGYISDGTTAAGNIAVSDMPVSAEWMHVVWTVDRTNDEFKSYVNGTLIGTTDISGITGSITYSDDIRIFRGPTTNYSGGVVGEFFLSHTLWSQAQVRKHFALPANWKSQNGNLTRLSDLGFRITFTANDTVWVPVTNGSSQTLTFRSFRQLSAATLVYGIKGSSFTQKGTQAITTSSTEYMVNLLHTFDSDSLYFTYTGTDTVSIDNVSILESSGSGKLSLKKLKKHRRLRRLTN